MLNILYMYTNMMCIKLCLTIGISTSPWNGEIVESLKILTIKFYKHYRFTSSTTFHNFWKYDVRIKQNQHTVAPLILIYFIACVKECIFTAQMGKKREISNGIITLEMWKSNMAWHVTWYSLFRQHDQEHILCKMVLWCTDITIMVIKKNKITN